MHHFRDRPGRWTSIGTWPRVPRIVLAVFLAACASLLAPAAAWALTGTTTALVSDHNPSVFGQAVTFTATVTPLGAGTPTGTVSFFIDGAPTSVGLSVAGQATLTTSTLSVVGSPHSVTAVYSGDANFSTSAFTLVGGQVVNLASTTTSVVSTANPSVFGQTVTFTATVSVNAPGSGTPTGTVTFLVDAVPFSVALPAGGQVTFSVSSLSVAGSPHTVQASYGGDSNFTGSTGTLSGGQAVLKDSTTTNLVSSQNPSTPGQTVTFTATVSASAPGSGTPTGTVTFLDGATTIGGPIALGGGGVVSFSISSLSAGGHAVSAVYSGDSNFNGSTSSLTQNVNPTATGTALVSSQNPSAVGQPVTFTATVSGSGGTPTGTVTFKDGASTIGGPVALGGGTVSLTISSLAAGSHSISAVYSGDAVFAGSTATLTQNVNLLASNSTLASSQNPSAFGQSVTFTATVSGSGGTPTGTVTFRDGASTIGGPVTLAAGVATFATSSLVVGSHSITAVYGGDGQFGASTSAALAQAVNTPADSIKLRALQVAGSKIEAQSSGQAISGAVDGAISDGFNDNGQPIMASENGVRFNFAAEPQPEKTAQQRVDNAFSALGYANSNVTKAPPRPQPKEWLAWADVRGTAWNTGLQTGDIRGGQTNALLGLTRKLSPDFLVGVFGGLENFDYTSQMLNGRLKGDGWTAGGYLGWHLLPGLRFDAGVARSGISYDGTAGTANGTFPGQRWLATAALVGTYKTMSGFEIEPSIRAYGLWEHQSTYTDSLGIVQAERNFSSGRASAGIKVAHPWMWSATATVTPFVGVYSDYYFNSDDAQLPVAPVLLPSEFVQGWSARVTSGLAVDIAGGPKLSVGGEVGGLGSNQFTTWSVRGRAAVPF